MRARRGRGSGEAGVSTGKPRPARRLSAALAGLARALEELPGAGMIIGGIAVIAHGVPRVTRDIDATVSRHQQPIALILEVMGRHGIEPRIADAAGFAVESAVLLLEHRASRVEIDLSLASLGFEQEALQAARRTVIAGIEVRIARPEDLVIYKSAAWRPQDRQDVQRLIELHGPEMDLGRVRRLVTEICTLLEVPERVAELEDMLRDRGS